MLAATKVKLEPGRLLIAGRWVETVKKFDSINPATAEVLTEISVASGEDVDRAVAAARHAFEDRNGAWRKLSAGERGRLIWKLADLLENNIDEFAELETLDNGKPIFESRYVDMPMVVDVLRYYAGWATKTYGETVNTFETAFTYTLRACRRCRNDCSLELSAAAGFVEAWSGVGLRQYGGVEAGEPDFSDRATLRRTGR
jgi:aldehyde dehydrogenase (NAD+)